MFSSAAICNECHFKTSDASVVKKHRMMFHPHSIKDGQNIYFQPQKKVKFKTIIAFIKSFETSKNCKILSQMSKAEEI